jgi:hypothetical protein
MFIIRKQQQFNFPYVCVLLSGLLLSLSKFSFLQRRNMKANFRLIAFPLILCLLLVILQEFVNSQLDKASNTCGCACIDTRGDGQCEKVCGFEYSDLDQAGTCSIPNPPEWPPLLQIPAPEYRAVRINFIPFTDLPCK